MAKITVDELVEGFRQNNMEVQYFPQDRLIRNPWPVTVGSIKLSDIVNAVNIALEHQK